MKSFEDWHAEYSKQYAERGYDDAPPVADMRAAWDAAIEACAQSIHERMMQGRYNFEGPQLVEEIRARSGSESPK
jgi:hypothetical protein